MSAAFPLLRVRRCTRGGGAALTPAKLNLFFEIEGRRPDGYHDVTTLLIAVDFCDLLLVRERPTGGDVLTVSGESAPSGPENLVRKALAAMRRHRHVPPLEMTLRKNIPAGTGLAGGSGNAAGMLALLAELIAPDLSPPQLRDLAAEIGSDVPFFLGAGPAVGRGRGEELTPYAGRLFGGDRPHFLLLLPPVVSSTALAYRRVTFPLTSPEGPISFQQRTFESSRGWQKGLFNRLEGAVLPYHPELRELAEWLEGVAAGRWRMTGSGSAFFVVCYDESEAWALAAGARRRFSVKTKLTSPLDGGPRARAREDVSARRPRPGLC